MFVCLCEFVFYAFIMCVFIFRCCVFFYVFVTWCGDLCVLYCDCLYIFCVSLHAYMQACLFLCMCVCLFVMVCIFVFVTICVCLFLCTFV